MAAQSAELGPSVHAHLDSLARAVAQRSALLCLTRPAATPAASASAGGPRTPADAGTAGELALALHGLRISATVRAGSELAWARERGAAEWGVVGDDARAAELLASPTLFARESRVIASVDFASAAGCELRAAERCAEGDVLLAVPLSR